MFTSPSSRSPFLGLPPLGSTSPPPTSTSVPPPLQQPFYRRPTLYQHVTTTPDDTPFYGYLLLITTFAFFCASIYSTVLSKTLPPTGIPVNATGAQTCLAITS
jgi:hypothetical protein